MKKRMDKETQCLKYILKKVYKKKRLFSMINYISKEI